MSNHCTTSQIESAFCSLSVIRNLRQDQGHNLEQTLILSKYTKKPDMN